MLEMRHDDLVALAHVLHAPGLRDQVDAFCRTAHEDDFLRRCSANEASHRIARTFVCVGRAPCQCVRGTMNVRVLMRVEIRQTVDDRLRFLRGRGIVEPDELSSVHTLSQNWEVTTNSVDIKWRMRRTGLQQVLIQCGARAW